MKSVAASLPGILLLLIKLTSLNVLSPVWLSEEFNMNARCKDAFCLSCHWYRIERTQLLDHNINLLNLINFFPPPLPPSWPFNSQRTAHQCHIVLILALSTYFFKYWLKSFFSHLLESVIGRRCISFQIYSSQFHRLVLRIVFIFF